jgi:hypothetical protein
MRSSSIFLRAVLSGAVLADVGQLVDVFDPAQGLEHQRLEAGRDRGGQFEAQGPCPPDEFLGIGDVRRGDLVHHLRGCVAQHALRADVEDLDDPAGVRGDAGEVGAVENGVLQGPGLEVVFGAADQAAGLFDAGGFVRGTWFGRVQRHASPRSKKGRDLPALQLSRIDIEFNSF